ncbi:hypothetical protein D9M71_672380 [compost metagenome]
MLRRYRRVVVVEIQRHAVIQFDDQHRPEGLRGGQAKEAAQEIRRNLLVPAPDDGVVQLSAHAQLLTTDQAGCHECSD